MKRLWVYKHLFLHVNKTNVCNTRIRQQSFKGYNTLLLAKGETMSSFCNHTHTPTKPKVSQKEATDLKVEDVDPRDYTFPFENIVFEGGGSKGFAYVGVMQYLEEHDMLPKIKRFAGTSAGAITATYAALGYSARDLEDMLSEDMETKFVDRRFSFLSFIPNIWNDFGWNPGKRVATWFGEKIAAKSPRNDPDMTFWDLYRDKGVELCIVVTNLNWKRAEYCHPKTTPDMPIRHALRMSMAIPVLFAAVPYSHSGRTDNDIFVDGGLLCNYPIHCFDGWYLSMEKEDAFFTRLQPVAAMGKHMQMNNRFGSLNPKTLGCLVYEDSEQGTMRYILENRVGATLPNRPKKESPLFKRVQKLKRIAKEAAAEHQAIMQSVDAFMKALHNNAKVDWNSINKEELKEALENDDLFSREQAAVLFGDDVESVDKIFDSIDFNHNGNISFSELLRFIEMKGVKFQTRAHGYGRDEITGLKEFLLALLKSTSTNMKFLFFHEKHDGSRSVGINTGHVGLTDYNLEEADREFVVERGYNSTEAFMKHFIVEFPDDVTNKCVSPTESEKSASCD